MTQRTGELPRVQSPADGLEETVVVTGAGSVGDGVFAEGSGLGTPGRFDTPMPSALPAADDPFASSYQPTGVMPTVTSGGDVFGEVTDEVDADIASIQAQLSASRNEFAPTNSFPEASGDIASDRRTAPTGLGSYDHLDPTRVQTGRPMDMGVSAAAARQGLGQSGPAPLDAPTDIGQPSRGGARPERRPGNAGNDRLQDTEFKLADRSRKQKPKEPNRLVLALALGLVVLVGIGVAWFLTRGDGSGTESADADPELVANPEGTSDAASDDTTPPADPEPQVDEPTLFFDEAQTGPLEQGMTYSIDLVGEPPGSLLQVVVDDIPQGAPDPQLPDLILPAGRHSLYIQITNGAETTVSTPVEVYVIGDLPPRGFRANLSSVDIQNEGWVEAVRQFDEYRAAGHEGLQLAPLSEGYWNIFIGGLGEDRAAAQAYCESFALAVPDQCFPTFFEGAPASDGAGTTGTTAAESMTDDASSTSTSAAGG